MHGNLSLTFLDPFPFLRQSFDISDSSLNNQESEMTKKKNQGRKAPKKNTAPPSPEPVPPPPVDDVIIIESDEDLTLDDAVDRGSFGDGNGYAAAAPSPEPGPPLLTDEVYVFQSEEELRCEFTLEEEINRGAFSNTRVGVRASDDGTYAIKTIDRKACDKDWGDGRDSFDREVKILGLVSAAMRMI